MKKKKCDRCGGTGEIPIPCPENRRGCLVYHFKKCECKIKELEE